MHGDLNELSEGFVGEIVRIAKLSEKECLEVLVLMGKEGVLLGCLYFFEWMGLQEPCLVSPRACSVMFPSLEILFRNLPQSQAFSDVQVFKAAISGLCALKGMMTLGKSMRQWKQTMFYQIMLHAP